MFAPGDADFVKRFKFTGFQDFLFRQTEAEIIQIIGIQLRKVDFWNFNQRLSQLVKLIEKIPGMIFSFLFPLDQYSF